MPEYNACNFEIWMAARFVSLLGAGVALFLIHTAVIIICLGLEVKIMPIDSGVRTGK